MDPRTQHFSLSCWFSVSFSKHRHDVLESLEPTDCCGGFVVEEVT